MIEHNAGATTLGISKSGRFIRRYPNGWKGNGSTVAFKAAKAASLTGAGLAAYSIYSDYTNPDISTAKFGVNTLMTGVEFLGPIGAAASIVYVGVDTFVPGGWGTRPDDVRGVDATIGWFFVGSSKQ